MSKRIDITKLVYVGYVVLALASLGIISSEPAFYLAKFVVLSFTVLIVVISLFGLAMMTAAIQKKQPEVKTNQTKKPTFPYLIVVDVAFLAVILTGLKQDEIGLFIPVLVVVKIWVFIMIRVLASKIRKKFMAG